MPNIDYLPTGMNAIVAIAITVVIIKMTLLL